VSINSIKEKMSQKLMTEEAKLIDGGPPSKRYLTTVSNNLSLE
jgi:hypothetical protein